MLLLWHPGNSFDIFFSSMHKKSIKMCAIGDWKRNFLFFYYYWIYEEKRRKVRFGVEWIIWSICKSSLITCKDRPRTNTRKIFISVRYFLAKIIDFSLFLFFYFSIEYVQVFLYNNKYNSRRNIITQGILIFAIQIGHVCSSIVLRFCYFLFPPSHFSITLIQYWPDELNSFICFVPLRC